ncbi:A nuclease of the HNH/ENDO VII superwith conserved AHH family protein, partial [Orientia tsutsugamushi str. TA763]
AVAASNTSNILKKISPIKVLVDQTGINNHTTVALIAKTEDKVAAIFNVEKKDVGKIIANANIPNEKICLVDLNILKQKFGDTSLSIIQKLEKEEILLPKLPHVVANLQEGTSVVRFVSYGSNRDRGIKIGSKLGTQTHHLIPQQFLKEEIFNFCGIDIKNDVCNKMILYTPKGLKLATESSNIVRDTYAKMLKQLNPSLTQKEIQIISEWKVPLPNKQRSTHSGRHDNSYVLPIKEKLHDLWDDVKLGKLNKKECRKAVYDLMDELREGIKNGSTELNKPK